MKRALQLIVFACLSWLALSFLSACDTGQGDRVSDGYFTPAEASNLDWKVAVSLEQRRGAPGLAIKQSFIMPRERIILKLPDTYLRKENLYQRIEDFIVSSPGKISPHPDSPSARYLEAPIGEKVTMEYFYRADDPISYTQSKESFSAPIIRNDYFQFVGSMVAIFPIAIMGSPAFNFTMEWNLPTDFKVFNSFGAEKNTQSITTDFDKLRDAFFVAGRNIRSQEINVRNNPVLVTFEGTWTNIADGDFVDVVSRLLATQRETFKDDNFPYFLINFLSEDVIDCDRPVKFAGTAHPNSFRAIFPNGHNCKLQPEMKQLISHELMHMWIGKKIRVGEERGHIDGKWFTEGFTDYFGRILAYRAGVLDEAEFFNGLNRQLEKYYISDERFVTLKGLVERMYRRGYSTRALEEVPYQQGEIVAWRLNFRIKSATSFASRLDDVVLDMLAEADQSGGTKKFTVKEISEHVDKYAPGAFREEFGKITHGNLLTPPKLSDCRPVQRLAQTKFYRRPNGASEEIISYGSPLKTCEPWLK